MPGTLKIFAFGGSLRRHSITRLFLETAKEVAPPQVHVEIYDRLHEFPLFNQDQERDPPPIVREFKEKVKSADAILISTPEYNYSIPGYLKNAIDWASRPLGDNSFDDKPVAIMSGGGQVGGARVSARKRHQLVERIGVWTGAERLKEERKDYQDAQPGCYLTSCALPRIE